MSTSMREIDLLSLEEHINSNYWDRKDLEDLCSTPDNPIGMAYNKTQNRKLNNNSTKYYVVLDTFQQTESINESVSIEKRVYKGIHTCGWGQRAESIVGRKKKLSLKSWEISTEREKAKHFVFFSVFYVADGPKASSSSAFVVLFIMCRPTVGERNKTAFYYCHNRPFFVIICLSYVVFFCF